MKRLWASEEGMSLVEVMVVCILSLIVLASALSLVDSVTKNERAAQARHDTVLQLREALTKVSKETRQALAIGLSSTRSLLDMQTLVSGITTRVVYEVAGTDFRRTVCTNVDLAAPCAPGDHVIVAHVTSAEPFCYDPPSCTATAPVGTLSTIRIALSAKPEVFFSGKPVDCGGHDVLGVCLSSDIELRNIS